ncbi:MAG: peptidoglycan-associated lipoprotein [Geobacteraceae bacterium GWC2_55_20]|nr:MAG: peptidoglycan-associated lipoprotein [Geobacteraceae bacterium GWC2_55_20]OGU24746.1 MAG: peptidoglycan-associated lipoprotein [Geobacteraceae bacterium GWF2_54_21]HBA70698.1 peptidoglycan-associated lipoprotein Pal [Geobacter sp.]HCE66555.1 peptidoglycan-associated lipoprotein Pal [Geobacter sp.]
MRKNMLALLTGIALAALLIGGCANKEVVKGEEGIVPKAEPAKVEAAKPEVKPMEQPKPVEQAKPMEEIAPAKQVEQQAAKSSVAEAAFETIYFDFDKSDLRQDARDVLSKNAEIMLKSKPEAKIQIEGHCDERGSAEYNLALGERRAKSSLQYLVTLGIKPDRLSIISYGKEKPAVQGSDEAAWAKNRRSEFVVVK